VEAVDIVYAESNFGTTLHERRLVQVGPLGIQKVEAPTMYRQSAHEGGKVVGPGTHFC